MFGECCWGRKACVKGCWTALTLGRRACVFQEGSSASVVMRAPYVSAQGWSRLRRGPAHQGSASGLWNEGALV